MYKIYIDSSDRYKKEIRLLGDKYEILDKVIGDIDVSYEISQLLKKNDLTPSAIGSYEINRGPGSFTGLKIGAAIANVFNWALGKKKIDELVYPEYGKEPNIQAKSK